MYLYRTSVAIAKKILPTSLCDISRNTLQMLSAPHRTTTEILKTTQRNHGQFGVNYFGYFSSENGVGQAARLMKEAAVIANIPVSTSNFTVSNAWQNTVLHDGHHDEKLPYDVNLIHINADQVPVFLEQHGKDHMHNNQNIGFWAWELSQFPKRWHDNFAYFDEIWTPSTFTTQAIAEFSPIPVITVPHPITISEADPHMREALGIPQDQTVFLFIFDYMSIFQRKNPIAVIEAFCRAFQDNENVTLIIKAAHPEADIPASKRMEHYVKSHPSIRLIQDRYSMAQIHGLIHACSAYVSLHRSEGFGLTIAEAMAMGKPVIATDYSGNTDYMNTNNSFPVRYTLIEIAEKCGPYEPGNVWAQPEIGHAAELMRYVYEHPDHATLIGKRAAQDVANNLSPERIGTLMLQRLAIKYTAILS